MFRFSAHIRNNVYGLVAIFIALTMGTAWATHPGGANTISSEDIIDEEIRTWDIRDNHVRTPDLQDGAVNRFKLAKGSVVRERINNGAVNSDKLANDAVNSAKISDGAVTPSKLGPIPAARATMPQQWADSISDCVSINIPHDAERSVAFRDEDFDTENMHPSGDCQEANARLTAPRSGIYQISGALDWFADGIHDLNGDRYLNLKKNGSTYLATESRAGRRDDIHEVSTIAQLSQGDYITVTAYQTTGGTLALRTDRSYLAMAWIGPG